MTVFDHIGRFEVAKIDPDRVLIDPGDLAHISHNAKHQLLSLFFRSASPYITANPYVVRCEPPPKESLYRLVLINNNLDEELWGSGRSL